MKACAALSYISRIDFVQTLMSIDLDSICFNPMLNIELDAKYRPVLAVRWEKGKRLWPPRTRLDRILYCE
jgi:hypothetical protein